MLVDERPSADWAAGLCNEGDLVVGEVGSAGVFAWEVSGGLCKHFAGSEH
jgi:hypothetical protein